MWHNLITLAKAAWPTVKGVLEGTDTTLDAILVLKSFGFLRDSSRRGKAVVNEKFAPRFAIDSWHMSQYTRLCQRITGDPARELTPHERHILDGWMQTLHEAQQMHFKISISNLSWADPSNAAAVMAAEDAAISFLKEMASLCDMPDLDPATGVQKTDPVTKLPMVITGHTQRTNKADARDFIKNPATEYLLVWAERKAGTVFKSAEELAIWLLTHNVDEWAKKVGIPVDSINTRIGTPPAPAAGAPPPRTINDVAANFRARMKAKYDASKK